MNQMHAFEFVSHTPKPNEVLGKVWWDGKQIRSNSWKLLHRLQGVIIHEGGETRTYKDGLSFLLALPKHYKSGYLTVRKV